MGGALQGFCHADTATCQNSCEFPQTANDFRHAGLLAAPQISLQNGGIHIVRALDRTQEVAGSSPASSTSRIPAMARVLAFRVALRSLVGADSLARSFGPVAGLGSTPLCSESRSDAVLRRVRGSIAGT